MPYPYTVTISGLVSTLRQLRSAFPGQLAPDTLKKWGIAPNNETYVLHILRFLGLIDEEGRKVSENAKVFSEHEDDAFAKRFEALVRKAYDGLFEAFGDKAWELERGRLIAFFRAADDTSARVGLQQAATFEALAGVAGHGAPPAEPKTTPARVRKGQSDTPIVRKKSITPVSTSEQVTTPTPAAPANPRGPALTVRVEINLPVTEDQEVYDKIFRSIRANLLNE
jgi:hypothetical protein